MAAPNGVGGVSPDAGEVRGSSVEQASSRVEGASLSVLKPGYELYRRREAMGLLSLIPRDRFRGFLAQAREWARTLKDPLEGPDAQDPLRPAVEFALHLLPLPPFAVWVEDFLSHRARYMDSLGQEVVGATPRDPVLVRRRRFLGPKQEPWSATLMVRPGQPGWNGFMRFESPDHLPATTADVFREETIQEVQDRFVSFHDDTLRAFLRSALP